MIHRGPFQPLPCCDSVKDRKKGEDLMVTGWTGIWEVTYTFPPPEFCPVISLNQHFHGCCDIRNAQSNYHVWVVLSCLNNDTSTEDFQKDFFTSFSMAVCMAVCPGGWEWSNCDCMRLNSELAVAAWRRWFQTAVGANFEIFPICSSSSQKSHLCYMSSGCWEQERGCCCVVLEALGHSHLEYCMWLCLPM